jgi:hypothetical protein
MNRRRSRSALKLLMEIAPNSSVMVRGKGQSPTSNESSVKYATQAAIATNHGTTAEASSTRICHDLAFAVS